MGINVRQLKEIVAEKNTTFDALAGVLEIDRSTLYRKLHRGTQTITLVEAQKISDFLELNLWEILDIFWQGAESGTHLHTRY